MVYGSNYGYVYGYGYDYGYSYNYGYDYGCSYYVYIYAFLHIGHLSLLLNSSSPPCKHSFDLSFFNTPL